MPAESAATLAKMGSIAMTVRARFGFFLWLGFLVLLPTVAVAQNATNPTTESLFTVENVKVDATAESGTAARDSAIAAGQQEAWRQLLRRLALAEDFGKAETLSPIELEQVIRDISLSNERTASTRYRADLSVRFRPQPARGVMGGRGVQFSDLIGPTTLILPVWRVPDAPVATESLPGAPEEAPAAPAPPAAAPMPAEPSIALPPPGTELLWDDPNPWRRAWETASLPFGLIPLIVPLGDISDVADIAVDAAVLGDPTALPAIARRYGAQNVAVLLAVPQGGTVGLPERLEITVVNHTAGVDLPESAVVTVTLPLGATDASALYLQGVEATSLQLAENWKRQNAFGASAAGVLQMTAAIDRLEQWAEIRRRLEAVPLVTGAVPLRLALGEVRFTLNFRGDERQLALALSRQGLVMTPPPPDVSEPLYQLRILAASAGPL